MGKFKKNIKMSKSEIRRSRKWKGDKRSGLENIKSEK